MNPATCSIFFHNYYGNHENWLQLFATNIRMPFTLYYNIVEESIFNIDSDPADLESFFSTSGKEDQRTVIIRKSANKGKDIGGKLILLDAYKRLNRETSFGLFVHDKKSPYKSGNEAWAGYLLRTMNPDFAEQAITLLRSDEQAGIVAPSGSLQNEYDPLSHSFKSTNADLLNNQMNLYDVHPDQYMFVAGTMFWFRMQPVSAFFQKNHPLHIRAMLENGNVLDEVAGSYTHCWERLLTWIISSQGYKIKIL